MTSNNWPSPTTSAPLSRGIIGGDVWMPDLYHRRRTKRKTALRNKRQEEEPFKSVQGSWKNYCVDKTVTVSSFCLSYRPLCKAAVLKNLNESDHQPAADVPPQLTGSHLQEHLHVLQHREPGEEPLLREGLNKHTHRGHCSEHFPSSAGSIYTENSCMLSVFLDYSNKKQLRSNPGNNQH